MSMIKHFKDEEGYIPSSFHNHFLDKLKKDNARVKRLIARYKTAKPDKASKILVSIHKIIDKHM
jgi:flagellar motility protein MotE (MotC chaperone)